MVEGDSYDQEDLRSIRSPLRIWWGWPYKWLSSAAGRLHRQSLNEGNMHTYTCIHFHTSDVYIYKYVRTLKYTYRRMRIYVCIYTLHYVYMQRICVYNHVHVSTNTYVDTHLLYNLKSMISQLEKACCSLPALMLDSIGRIWSMVGTKLHWRFDRRLAPTLEKWQGLSDSSEVLVEQREKCSTISKLPLSYVYIYDFILMNDGFT